MYYEQYFDILIEMLRKVREDQKDAICRLARKIVDTVEAGCCIYVFGATHAGILAQEAFYRTGGLVVINPILPEKLMCDVVPITDTSRQERQEGYGAELVREYGLRAGDLLIVHSVSGRNAVPVDTARIAKEMGVFVAGITSLEYSGRSTPRAQCGKRLFEVCDLVIDNGGVFGDAILPIEGFAGKTAPTSTVIGAAIINAVCAEACGIFVERGIEPPVFMSANVDGGDEYNRMIMKKYRDIIHYL